MQPWDRREEQQAKRFLAVVDAAVCDGLGLAALRRRQKFGKRPHRVERAVGIAPAGPENRMRRVAAVKFHNAAVQDALPQRRDGVRRLARTPDHGERKRSAISVAGTQYSPSLHFRCQPDIGILHRGKIGKMRPALVVFQ